MPLRLGLLLILALLLPHASRAADDQPELRLASRRVLLPTPKTGVNVKAYTYYTRAAGEEMNSIHLHQTRSDTMDVSFLRRSADNGRTWSEAERVPTLQRTADGTLRTGQKAGFVDPVADRLIIFGGQALLANDKPLEVMTRGQLTYKLSNDGGRTFYHHVPIIHVGAEYSPEHPLPDVWLGKNAAQIGDWTCVPIRTRSGEILMPLQITPLGPDGKYHNPGGGYTYHDAAVLIGKWSDQETLDWRLSQRIVGDPKRSTRGMVEPTIIEAPDGRILMVMRGSNDTAGKIKGYRWRAISADGGRTWTAPEPWTYSGGEQFFSPSSCSRLIRHSSGALLWIGNISAKNPRANAPRYPLYIGRVDPQSLLLEKESLLIVDNRQEGDAEWMTLSNFYAYEDRLTREIAIQYSPIGRSHPLRKPGVGHDWTSDAVEARVAIQ